jgi:hypothetical protein
MSDLKDEVAATAKKVIEVFTVQYTKAYALALVRMIKEEMNKPPEPDWQLQKRPVCSLPQSLFVNAFHNIVSDQHINLYVLCMKKSMTNI